MQLQLTTNELARQIAGRFLQELPVSIVEQSGGLSGARVWRVESSRGTFALRQYPTEFPTEERLRWLHGFLKEVRDRGCALLPCPVSTSEGATWIKHESQLWELLTWVHGEPLLEEKPTRELLITAITTLADLHQQLEHAHYHALPHLKWQEMHAEGIRERRRLLQDWLTTDQAQIAKRFRGAAYSPTLLALFHAQQQALQRQGLELLARLDLAAATFVKIFPVLRDVQPGHVLFQEARVAGFIDLGAMRLDSAAADLARLLQLWRFPEPDWYADSLAAYDKVRPLSKNERVLVDVYDDSARLLTGVQWLRWIVLEEREFVNHDLVEQHWQRIVQDLERILNCSTKIHQS